METDRRSFIRGLLMAGAAVTLDGILGHEASAASLNKKGYLYDLQLGAFRSQESALAAKRTLQQKTDFSLVVTKEDGFYKLLADTNAVGEAADAIVISLKKNGIDAVKSLRSFFYNEGTTMGRMALVPVGVDGIAGVVKTYTTAYGDTELRTTIRNLQSYYAQKGLPTYPKTGELMPIPMRWLKVPYQIGMVEDVDFKVVELRRGETLWDVVNKFTRGEDAKDMLEFVRKYNEIKPSQVRSLQAGERIMIPLQEYRDPLAPTIIEVEDDDTARVVKERPITAETTLKQEALEQRIPEAAPDVNGHIRSQGLMVLRQVNMPAILIENLNVNNKAQQRFWQDRENLEALADSYARGIAVYIRNNPNVKKVFIDDGHGKNDPGALDRVHGSGKHESWYTHRIQKAIVQALKRRGIDVRELDYTGNGRQRARLNWLVNKANTQGRSRDSVYISIHADAAENKRAPISDPASRYKADWQPRPHILVERGQQLKSRELASTILAQALPAYEARFRG